MGRYTRADWAYRHPAFSPLGRVSTVFLHHTVSAPIDHFDAGYMRALEESEIARGGYIALAYHWMFLTNGDRVESRPWGTQGGATINNNSTSVAVTFIGNAEIESISNAALDAAAANIREGIAVGAITPNPWLRPHSDVFATACPGRNLRPLLPEIANRVASGGSGPIPGPTPVEDDLPYTPEEVTRFVASGVERALKGAVGTQRVQELVQGQIQNMIVNDQETRQALGDLADWGSQRAFDEALSDKIRAIVAEELAKRP